MLSIVRAVEINSLRVFTRASVITSNDEVRSAVVLSDDGVPDGLAGSTHTHSKGQKAENSHAIGVSREQCLVNADAGEVVNVTRLGESDDGVDQDVSLTSTSGADSELAVGAMHRVSRLESDHLGPAKLVEVQTELGGSVCCGLAGW